MPEPASDDESDADWETALLGSFIRVGRSHRQHFGPFVRDSELSDFAQLRTMPTRIGVRTRLQNAMNGDLGDAAEALNNRDASPDLIEICRACLNSNREQRPKDASSVAELIANYIDSVQQRLRLSELQRQKDLVQSGKRRKRRRIAFVTASMLILALTGSAFLYIKTLIERRRLSKDGEPFWRINLPSKNNRRQSHCDRRRYSTQSVRAARIASY